MRQEQEQGYDVPDSFNFPRFYKDQKELLQQQLKIIDGFEDIASENQDLEKRRDELLLEESELDLHHEIYYSTEIDAYSQERIRQFYHDYSSGYSLNMMTPEMWNPVEQQRFKDIFSPEISKQLVESDKSEEATKELLLYFRPYLLSFIDQESVTPRMQEIVSINEVNHVLDDVEALKLRQDLHINFGK